MLAHAEILIPAPEQSDPDKPDFAQQVLGVISSWMAAKEEEIKNKPLVSITSAMELTCQHQEARPQFNTAKQVLVRLTFDVQELAEVETCFPSAKLTEQLSRRTGKPVRCYYMFAENSIPVSASM